MQMPQPSLDRRVFERLMKNFDEGKGQAPESRWQWLMAAHVVGQHHFALHLRMVGDNYLVRPCG